METPLVSVLVPIYNVEPTLRQCLELTCAQTLRDIEVILVDDGSTDGSGAIADGFAAADGRVRVIHKPNSGYGDSLNRALDEARGEWVSIVEPDDWTDATMLAHLVERARALATPERPVDIVKCAYWRVVCEQRDGEVRPLRQEPSLHLELVKPAAQPFTIDECPMVMCLHPSIWSAIYRRAFLEEFGIRFLPIPGAGWADNPFFVETLVAARAIAWLDEPLYHYREIEDASISHLAAGSWRIIPDRWAEMAAVLEKYDVASPDILEAHTLRGCAYLEMLLHDFDMRDPAIRTATIDMAASIDPALVYRSDLIPPEYRRAYRRAMRLASSSRL